MNEAVLTPPRLEPNGLDDLLGLVGLSSQRRSKQREMPSGAEEILHGITEFVESLLLKAIAAQNKSEFETVRTEVIGQYARAITYLAGLARLLVPESVMQKALNESFCELEADFRDQALARFGPAAKEQAVFTVWTLRRASGLIAKITASGNPKTATRKDDKKLAEEFSLSAIWAQFHLDCLVICIRRDRLIQLDVLPEIIDGLRAAVNAYGLARQGLNLRTPEQEVLIGRLEWDEEDRELVDTSMADMALENLDS